MPLSEIIAEFKLPVKVCKRCRGEGEITIFCGHDFEQKCPKCKGKGYVRKRIDSRRK